MPNGLRLPSVGISARLPSLPKLRKPEEAKEAEAPSAFERIFGTLDKPRLAVWNLLLGQLDRITTESLGPGTRPGPEKLRTARNTREFLDLKYPLVNPDLKDRVLRGIFGFAGDVAVDPLTYITAGGGNIRRGITALSRLGQAELKIRQAKATAGLVPATGKFQRAEAEATHRFLQEIEQLQIDQARRSEFVKAGLRFAGVEIPGTRQFSNVVRELSARAFPETGIVRRGLRQVFAAKPRFAIVREARERGSSLRRFLSSEYQKITKEAGEEINKAIKAGEITAEEARRAFGRESIFDELREAYRRGGRINPSAIAGLREPIRRIFLNYDRRIEFLSKAPEQFGAKIPELGGPAKFRLKRLEGKLRKLDREAEQLTKGLAPGAPIPAPLARLIRSNRRQAGKLAQEVSEQRGVVRNIIGYSPRIDTPEFRERIDQVATFFLSKSQQSGIAPRKFLEKRTRAPVPIRETERIILEEGTKATGGRPFEVRRIPGFLGRVKQLMGKQAAEAAKPFVREPVIMVAVQAERAAAISGQAEMFKVIAKAGMSARRYRRLKLAAALGDSAAIQALDVLSPMRPFPASRARLFPILRGKVFPVEMIVDVERLVVPKLSSSAAVEEFIQRFFDPVNAFWKGSVTVIWPAFHARNFLSNMWQLWLAGVTNPKMVTDAAQAQFLAATDPKKLSELFITTPSGARIGMDVAVDEARRLGVLQDQMLRMDLFEMQERFDDFERPFMRRAADNLFFRAGRKLGTQIEGNARFAVFIDRLAKGEDFFTAARTVKKYLFDYADLTDIERRFFRRLLPFYTWTRFNIPLQVMELLQQPGKFALVPKAIQNTALDGSEDTQALLPSYIRNQMNIVLKRDGNTLTVLYGTDLPFEDLTKLALSSENLRQTILGSLTPPLKLPLELILELDLFTGRGFRPFRKLQKIQVPEALSEMPEAAKRLMGLERNKKGKLVADPRALRFIYTTPLSRILSILRLTDQDDQQAFVAASIKGLIGATVGRIELAREPIKLKGLRRMRSPFGSTSGLTLQPR